MERTCLSSPQKSYPYHPAWGQAASDNVLHLLQRCFKLASLFPQSDGGGRIHERNTVVSSHVILAFRVEKRFCWFSDFFCLFVFPVFGDAATEVV